MEFNFQINSFLLKDSLICTLFQWTCQHVQDGLVSLLEFIDKFIARWWESVIVCMDEVASFFDIYISLFAYQKKEYICLILHSYKVSIISEVTHQLKQLVGSSFTAQGTGYSSSQKIQCLLLLYVYGQLQSFRQSDSLKCSRTEEVT